MKKHSSETEIYGGGETFRQVAGDSQIAQHTGQDLKPTLLLKIVAEAVRLKQAFRAYAAWGRAVAVACAKNVRQCVGFLMKTERCGFSC